MPNTMSTIEKKVLLVENNDLDVVIINRLMKKMSLDLPVVHARNGEEALDILRSELAETKAVPAFVILLDLQMPQMNGFEFMESLQEEPYLSQIEVYILTTSLTRQDITKAHSLAATNYILKPIKAGQLKHVVGHECSDSEALRPFNIKEIIPFDSTGETGNPNCGAANNTAVIENIAFDKIIHDLRAPIVNAKGFKLELLDALEELKTLIDDPVTSLNSSDLDRVKTLYDEDLEPCLNFLFDAVDMLEQRVQDFANKIQP